MKKLLILLALLSFPASAEYVVPTGDFLDSTFEIKDNADPTSKLKFGITNQTGETFTINVNGTSSDSVTIPGGALLTDSGTAQFSNKVWDSNTASNNIIADGVTGGGAWVFFDTGVAGGSSVGSEALHYVKFLNSDFNDQTHTFPDASGEVCQLPTVQTLTNKTIVAANNTITTAASGNLAATNLNAALAELQTDIDTRETITNVNAKVSDTAYAGSWNGVTTIAPSKNAVYDEVEARFNTSTGHDHDGSDSKKIPVGSIDATGTPDNTTYLRGDGTWSTPSGGSGAPRTHITLATSILPNVLAAGAAPADNCTLTLSNLTTTKRQVGTQVMVKMDDFANARGIFRLKNAGGQSGQISCQIRNVTDSTNLIASTNVTTGTACVTAEGTATPALTGVKQLVCECSGGNATDDPLLAYCGLELSP